MNQAELAQIRVMIDEAVGLAVDRAINRAVQPIRDELDTLKNEAKELEADSRKHSGEQKKVTEDVKRTSQNDLKQDSAIAQILVTQGEHTKDIALVKKAQEDAKAERANTASNVDTLVNVAQKFGNKYPAATLAIVGFLSAVASALTTWLQGRGH